MYCVKCGVKLADTEQRCPLCKTVVYHPEITRPETRPLYPDNRMPAASAGRKTFGGIVIILFLIPLIISFVVDVQLDRQLEWFSYVAGALSVGYVIFALPCWFAKPNPVIFIPCDFAAVALYLQHINCATKGNWFFGFALPVTVGVGLIVCTVVTLLRYVRRGRLYIFGGATIALGALCLLIEVLLEHTFRIGFMGWSYYPLTVFTLLGGLQIYLAINRFAREVAVRKLFF